jgi:hypothetical protein
VIWAAIALLAAQAAQLQKLGYDGGEQRDPAPLIDQREIAHARFEFTPREAEVGEPVELALIVPHKKGERVDVDASAFDKDLAWAVLEGPTRSTEVEGENATLRMVWKVAALEPGQAHPPELDVRIARGAPTTEPELIANAELAVRGVLGANEDAPRDVKGFREIQPEPSAPWWQTWLPAGIALVLVSGAIGWWLARRRRPQPVAAPTTLERLDALAQRDLEQSESVRDLHFELARTLREHFDGGQGVARRALTDEEWLRSVAAGMTPERLTELGEVLRTSELVKYGAVQPTQWAVRETLERARKVASFGVSSVASEVAA